MSPEEAAQHGVLAKLHPLPRFENLAPADVFRVFERGVPVTREGQHAYQCSDEA